ncbi:metal ABC transporter substrate-binding protein [Propionivibrio dicarboxylicus]|uniref:Zinc/manganese transport system substrate-binding protein n=1 Tax=Propionivibrio dicarboxylicus TaxID=83767 RepID=A0A1G8ENK0_9RHOO|nr:zinc ABC transporter substrate-binding protein [Propionivibrio dicarboxylicus]SDH71473.1 zinc/manganese transport system substrate-binding protein [Propionivibrio dicarboxylicus]
MIRYARNTAALLLAVFALPSFAALNILACEPEWGALAQELGGDKVTVFSATNAFQDPHHIQAKPSLLARARNADLVICTGVQLEVGWLPILLKQAGNPKIQEGQPGYFEAAKFVRMLEVPTSIDRSLGDVHPGGNPHIQMDPRNIALIAEGLAKRLAEIDAANSTVYQARYASFADRWKKAIAEWERQAAPLRGLNIVVHHKAFIYLENWLGLKEVATLEPKPGVEPTSGHLSEVLAQLQRQPARAVIRSTYNDSRGSEWLAERAKIPAVLLPFTVGGSDQAKDLFGFFDDVIQRLLMATK